MYRVHCSLEWWWSSGRGGGEQSSHLSWNPHQIPALVRPAVFSVADLLLQMKTGLNWT